MSFVKTLLSFCILLLSVLPSAKAETLSGFYYADCLFCGSLGAAMNIQVSDTGVSGSLNVPEVNCQANFVGTFSEKISGSHFLHSRGNYQTVEIYNVKLDSSCKNMNHDGTLDRQLLICRSSAGTVSLVGLRPVNAVTADFMGFPQ